MTEPTDVPPSEPQALSRPAPDAALPEVRSDRILVEVDYDRHVSFALQQNAVPLVKGMRVRNLTAEPLAGLRLVLKAEPDLSPRVELPVPEISPHAAHRFDDVDLPLAPTRLANQAEREAGHLVVEVHLDDEVLLRALRDLDVLPCDAWPGPGSLPEILAAFVRPDHPEVVALGGQAAQHVEDATGEATVDGYAQRDPAHARAVAAGAYAALAALAVTHVPPLAGLEEGGRTIRPPDEIVAARTGTDLDLAVLAASVLEQAGLHALVVLLADRALVGVWLEEESFVDPALDERMRVEKRLDLGSIVLFDPTGATMRPALAFDDAVAQAAERFRGGDAGTFVYAVDVQAARRAGIRPLPTRRQETLGVETQVEEDAEPEVEAAPPAPLTRVERWKRRLLDLSLRNRLLNHRATRKTIRLDCPDLARLEDRLAGGKAFRLLPKAPEPPPPAEGAVRPTPVDGEVDPEVAERLKELASGRLRTDVSDEDLERRLVHVYRAARLSLQEGGANTLYLAVGFLRWFEAPSSTTPRLAPILLFPLVMTRRSIAEGVKGYRIELADDDPQINVTLLQKLDADYEIRIPGLDELDTDDHGLDVTKILDRVRSGVKAMPRWEVVEDAVVGLFSFTKYLMWLDLDRRTDQLTENDVVRHLLETPEEPFPGAVDFPDPSTFDDTRSPVDTFVPMKADSSQQTAIFAAADGHTFVLEGPPGTGKSQTITNLVSHALATGKRVLFVSEKIAALDVVHKRLSRAGLDPFCLEIHSNKARKRAVLEQLRRAIEVAGTRSPDAWPKVAEQLGDVRTQVNDHTQALHRTRSIGRSVFHGLSRLIALAETPRIRLDFGAPDAMDGDGLEARTAHVKDARVALDEIGDVREHAWNASTLEEWLPSLPGLVDEQAPAIDGAAETLERAAGALAEHLMVDATGLSRAELEDLGDAAARFAATPLPPEGWLTEAAFPIVRERVEGWIRTGRAMQEHAEALAPRFDERILDLDLLDARQRLERAAKTVWPFSWFKARPAKKALGAVLASGSLPATEALRADVEHAIDWKQRREELQAADAEGRQHLGVHWRGAGTDWGRAAALLAWVEPMRGMLRRLRDRDADRADALTARWVELSQRGREVFGEGAAAEADRRAFGEARTRLADAQAQAASTFALDEDRAWGAADEPSCIARVRSTAARWLARKADLRGWCGWMRARRALAESGLGGLLEAVETGRVETAGLEDAFEHAFYAWWIEGVFETEPVLRRFRGAEQNARIDELNRLDAEVMDVTTEVVRARLAQQLPSGRAAAESRSDSSEMGLLHRELMKKRNIPIRQLFARIPNVLVRLKPCLLMSPLSVAQYLGPDFPRFDLVVFDEASQIPPWDAVGAIARGEKLVVVGDSKQLPPTNFFDRSQQGDEIDDEDDLAEMESILDECVAARLPRLHLGWHYRSKHESLIAFSNVHYYENRLFTFPSAAETSPVLGVSWRHVAEGVYDKGRSRTNRPEAEALVADLVARLQDAEGAKRSYGVVTFSIAQQGLVEDLLEEARRDNPELEAHFDDAREEPVFVKNLENVQGDERDVILMSVCYGPDADGRVSLNFGPLNREGGERRLNVAITRSREQVVVFSTMRSEQIDLARTQSRGAKHLKEFLEYAEQGTAALGQALALAAGADDEASFESGVGRTLTENGWQVDHRVGCSAYRIDLGVKDPEEEGRYLLAVESDGATYGRAATARDRHGTRPGVLGHLGWRHYRAWSTDWWQDPAGEAAKLLRAAEAARDARRAAREQEGAARKPESALREEASPPAPSEPADEDAPAPRSEPARPSAPPPKPLGLRLGGVPYQRADLGRRAGEPHEFYRDRAEPMIVRRIEKVIEAEGPVALGVIARRLADAWGLKRITTRLKDRVGGLVSRASNWRFGPETADFFWRRDQDPRGYAAFRVPGAGAQPARRARHIPPEEIANAASVLLREHVSIDVEDLARETARLFGYRRITQKVRTPMEAGVRRLAEQERARLEGDRIRLP